MRLLERLSDLYARNRLQRATPLRGSLALPRGLQRAALERLSEPCARDRSPVKSMKNRFQQLPKTIQKPSQIQPKTLKNQGFQRVPLEIAFRSQLFPLLARAGPPLGGVLGCFRAVLWRLGRVLGRLGTSWGRLGPSWERLVASCVCLGASCGFSSEKPSEHHRLYFRKAYPNLRKSSPRCSESTI